jgi:hypothetical protein
MNKNKDESLPINIRETSRKIIGMPKKDDT